MAREGRILGGLALAVGLGTLVVLGAAALLLQMYLAYRFTHQMWVA